jgi:hypothetical protein
MDQAKNRIVLALIVVVVIAAGTALAFYNRSSLAPVNNRKNTSVQPASQEIKAKLIVNYGSSRSTYDTVTAASSTVFALLEQLSQANNFSLSYRQSQLGVFVEAIAGIKNDNATNSFWLYKVNGKIANVGASNYVLHNNDEVEWYYGTVSDFK